MGKEKGHYGSADLQALHDKNHKSGTTEGGSCLTGHLGDFKNFGRKSTCNYRYQAYEQAKAESQIKDRLHSYNDKIAKGKVATSAYPTAAKAMAPAYYCATLPMPGKGDWDIGGPPQDIKRTTFQGKVTKIKGTHNFTRDTWPYWNNAHHLIPKGTLKATIVAEDAPVSQLIQQALLEAKYNVNHKVNMLLMPQDKEVAELLGLPRHIQLKENDEPDLDAMCTDHPVYNEMVVEMDQGLKKIVADYRKICDDAIKDASKKKHATPSAELDKSKLEELSRKLLRIILDWSGGPSLDAFAKRSKKKS